MLLYIVRHGIPDYATDTLTPDGRKQAEALVARLAPLKLDEIYASPLGRARQTAEPTCRALGLEAQIEPWMSENVAWNAFHTLNPDGKHGGWAFWKRSALLGSNERYENRDSFSSNLYADDEVAREGAAALRAASNEFLSRQGYEYTGEGNGYRITRENNKRIAAFCHQGFGLHWLACLLKIPYHIFTASFDISHTGISVVRFADSGNGVAYPICLCLSDLSHLYGSNLPLKYHNNFII